MPAFTPLTVIPASTPLTVIPACAGMTAKGKAFVIPAEAGISVGLPYGFLPAQE